MGKAPSKKLVLFDFDGTITTKDTLVEFLMYYKGPVAFAWGMVVLSPVLLLHVLKLIPNWKAKQQVLRYFLKGENEKIFNNRCQDFAKKLLPKLIRSGALDAIEKYKKEGATVAIVTASAENWVNPWCSSRDIVCVGTQLEVKGGHVTGNLCGANCYGPEKVRRIEQQFQLSAFDHIVAYGDSAGDKEMLTLAHQSHYKPFRSQFT